MAIIKTFPQVIFVTVEQDGKNDWLSANLTKGDSLGDSDKAIVGMYQFVGSDEVTAQWTAKRLRNRRTR